MLKRGPITMAMPSLRRRSKYEFCLVILVLLLNALCPGATNSLTRFVIPSLSHPRLDTNSGLYFANSSNLWSLAGSIPNGNFGQCVVGGKDLNGEGGKALLVGWPTRIDSEGAILGAVTLLSMRPWGLVTNGVILREWPENLSRFGSAICLPGDVNGDGRQDILVGAPGDSKFHPGAGRVMLWTNTLEFARSLPNWEFAIHSAGAGTGAAIAGVGDLNGDGLDDVLIGAPTWKVSNLTFGASLLFMGADTGLAKEPLLELSETGIPNADSHGFALSGVGDFNGDGYPDAVIGMPHSRTGEGIAGAAVFYFGTGHALTSTDTPRIKGRKHAVAFGSSIAAIGDINGDGYTDVGVGAPLSSPQGADVIPYVAIYQGSPRGFSSEPLWETFGPERDSSFGASLAVAGDVDGDGYVDLLVGSPAYANGVEGQGAVFLYRGKAGTFETTPSWCVLGGQPHARTGVSIAAIGDVNEDGFSDFAVGSSGYSNMDAREGRVDVFLGGYNFCQRTSSVKTSMNEASSFSQTGWNRIPHAAEANRRGSWIVSASYYGVIGIGFVAFGIYFAHRMSIKRLHKQMKIESERALMEERNRERMRFAQDLHDLMGSSMTLLPPDTQRQIREIIWTETPGHDHLGSFAEYLISRSQEFFNNSGIAIRFDIPLDLPRHPLKGNVRKELFLATFVALVNARQHAQATTVWLRMRYEGALLSMLVEDDGRGFPPEILKRGVHTAKADGTGNGLPNMQCRIEALGGLIELRNRGEGGALVVLSLDLQSAESPTNQI